MVGARLSEKSLGLISTVVLARMLLPEHFGVVMLATAILAALELMGAFGFETILIQKQDATRDHYDTVWTLGLLFNGAYALILIILAWPAATFYDDQRLVMAMLAIALSRVIASTANIGVVNFRKDLQFDKEFHYNVVRKLVTVSITIISAYLLRDHRALLVGILVGAVYGAVLSYIRHPFRPRLSLRCRSELFREAKWLFIHNTLFFVNTRYADFVIAKVSGLPGLGVFSVANEFSSVPVTEIAAPINRAAMPAFAKLHNDRTALESLYKTTVEGTVMITFPVAVGLAACAELFTEVILGAKWTQVGSILPYFCFAVLPLVIANNNGVVLLALSETKAVALQSLFRAILLVVSLPIGLWFFDLVGAAYAFLFVNLIFAPFSHWILISRTAIKTADFIKPLLIPSLSSGLMWLSVVYLERVVSRDAYGLTILVAAGAAVYVTAVFSMWLARGRPQHAFEAITLRQIDRMSKRVFFQNRENDRR